MSKENKEKESDNKKRSEVKQERKGYKKEEWSEEGEKGI